MASPSLPPPHEPLTLAGLAPWLLTVSAGAILWLVHLVIGQELKAIRESFISVKKQLEKVEVQLEEVLDEIHALGKEVSVANQRITSLEARCRQLEADQRRHSA